MIYEGGRVMGESIRLTLFFQETGPEAEKITRQIKR
jgi:hypothetical protein